MNKQPIDWALWKCRCSSLSFLFTEPKLKADKDAGNLSETAKTHLLEVYLEYKYGILEEIETKEMKKGKAVESKIISILGAVDGEPYVKNTQRLSNEWIEGEVDIVANILKDVKAPWEMSTLLPHLVSPVPKNYEYQMIGYECLWEKEEGEVCWLLVDCPEDIYLEEQKKEYFKSGVIWDEDPAYLAQLAKLKRRLIVEDYIPLEERMIRKKVKKDYEIIEKIPEKVTKARKYLQYLDETHRTMSRSLIPAEKIEPASIPLIKIK